MSKKKHGAAHDDDEGHAGGEERWLLTYADMITLLLALFILLFSVSTINQKKFEALALGLKATFNPNPGVLPNSNGLLQNSSLVKTAGTTTGKPAPQTATTPTTTPTIKTPPSAPSASQEALAALEQQVAAALRSKGLAGSVSESLGNGELTVQLLDDKVFFASDSADLGSVGDQVIDTVAQVLAPTANLIDVNGYTDNQAITGGPYTSNEELSAVRAVNVVLRLSRTDGLAASRLAATGFGDSRPSAPNDTPAHMALNRRIDIVVLAGTGA
ncbi:OmpA family protein [Acidiferrimicrobium sp. IK]|uniref:flagellar motor protein MotB n=1 Tax=Acidiferrimicrobium sp. IK TaxID=2871700 RepID=UPI0021CAF7D3|nr:flagellar motor protein MotB [Acidiferrimicrobium sp. IK]MCU4185042.1 OmpA family protein [Acidiferrimicrobium sp. IK]